MLGPVFPPGAVGGLQLALSEVIDQLRARGWSVDDQIWAGPAPGADNAPASPWQSTYLPSRLASLGRPLWLQTAWIDRAPVALRQIVSATFMPAAYFSSSSRNLDAAERLLADAGSYDVVLFCVDGAPPGMSAMVAETAGRAVFVSLLGLETELRSAWWPWARQIARWHLRERLHPFLFRPLTPGRIPLTIFASGQWRRDAVRAGLPASRGRTIYFGVPLPEPLPRPAQAGNRLLWVGRLSFEKGLHLLLQALPAIRRRIPTTTLTIVAGQGSDAYRRLIDQAIRRHRLQSVVTVRAPVERDAIREVYASHDALFFHSAFAEPVSLVLMEAFAAGLPVVASRACPEARLVQDDVTCLCYDPGDPETLVRATVRMLTEARVRARVAMNAQQLVRHEFSLPAMGQAYDEVLRAEVERVTATR